MTQSKPRRTAASPAHDLVRYLVEEQHVTAEAGPGACRVTATLRGRCMVLCRDSGWWTRERPTTGDTVLERMQPEGMEWVTARTVAAMLANGCGVRL